MKRLAALLSIAAVLGAGPAFAQSNDCSTPINGTLKGEAGNDQDNVFHSLTIDPTDDRIVYVGTETNGIFKTTDGGATWTRLRTGLKCTTSQSLYPEIYDMAVDPNNHLTVYAATVTGPGPASPVSFPSASAGVYKSADGGATWTQKNDGLPNTYVTQILVDAANSGRVYAFVGGLKASFPTGTNTFYDGGIYVSNNGGDTWTALTPPAGVEKNTFTEAALRGTDQRTIYASTQIHKDEASLTIGMIRSTDAGATWSVANPDGETVLGFDAARTNPSLIYANVASGKRAHKSIDGGASWTATGPAILFGVTRIHPSNPLIAFYTGSPSGSIWKTIDGFSGVQQVYADSTLAADQHLADIEISPSNPNTIWAASTGYYLYRSTDGGQSWSKITAVRDIIYGGASGEDTDPLVTLGPVKFSDTSSARSYLRIFNPTAVSGTAQIIVRDEHGVSLGSYIRQVDAYTSPQFSMAELEVLAQAAAPSRTGAFAQIDVRGDFAGFVQHVIYDTATGALTNLSVCRTAPQGVSGAVGSSTSVGNAHTTNIPANPSRIVVFNGGSSAQAAQIDIYDATDGANLGRWTSETIPAGGEILAPLSQIQQDIHFTPSATQYHINLNVAGSGKIVLGHIVDNLASGVSSDMSVRCAF